MIVINLECIKDQQPQTMDDLHSFHKQQYEKSADLEKLTRWQRFVILVKVLPRLVVKLVIVVLAELYYSIIRPMYRYFVPKAMNIRGQVAVVSAHSMLTLFYCISISALYQRHK